MLVVAAGCYEPPGDSCTILCTEGEAGTCPSGMTCTGGYCVDPGSTCTTALVALRTGGRHACGLDADGHAICWGDGREGQVGSVIDAAPAPIYVGDATTTWVGLATGNEHTCAIKGDGTVWCWGENDDGESRAIHGGIANVPAQVPSPPSAPAFEQVWAGGAHSCALGQGQAWCWGRAASVGTAGDSSSMKRFAPAVDDFVELATGTDHTCGISASTGIWCGGNNDNGQAGQDPPSGVIDPTMVAIGLPAGKVAIHITAGNSKTCAIMADAADASSGELWCWGYNNWKDLGGGGSPVLPAKLLTPDTTWTAVSAGAQAICGIRDHTAYCWGTSTYGQLGDGVWAVVRTPAQPAELGPADEISVANETPSGGQRGYDELACLRDGTQVRCWGGNLFGDVGIGNTSIAAVPTPVVAPSGHWQHVWASGDHTCGQTDDGALYCWGANTDGAITAELGHGSANLPCTSDALCDVPLPMLAPSAIGHPEKLAIGSAFTCALEGGAITCWGTPDRGVLGASRSTPGVNTVTPPAGQQWARLFGGDTAACGLTTGGVMSCWGHVIDTDVSSPAPIADPLLAELESLQFGDAFACAAQTSGGRVCWGANDQGQLGNNVVNGTEPSPVLYGDTVAMISSRASYSCAVVPTGGLACWGANGRGQCGQTSGPQITTPSLVSGAGAPLAACTQVAAGREFACAICGDKPWCWGAAGAYELGRGDVVAGGPTSRPTSRRYRRARTSRSPRARTTRARCRMTASCSAGGSAGTASSAPAATRRTCRA